jgi:hypothetical protein
MTPTIEQKRDAVINDTFDTCLNDSGYLLSVIQDLYRDKSDEEIERAYNDAFDF